MQLQVSSKKCWCLHRYHSSFRPPEGAIQICYRATRTGAGRASKETGPSSLYGHHDRGKDTREDEGANKRKRESDWARDNSLRLALSCCSQHRWTKCCRQMPNWTTVEWSVNSWLAKNVTYVKDLITSPITDNKRSDPASFDKTQPVGCHWEPQIQTDTNGINSSLM